MFMYFKYFTMYADNLYIWILVCEGKEWGNGGVKIMFSTWAAGFQ